jgi:hypothetical protein
MNKEKAREVVMSKCLHRNSIAVDIDGEGENFRFCNDCGENFWLTVAAAPAKGGSVKGSKRTCPHCGNTDSKHIQGNGEQPSSPDLTRYLAYAVLHVLTQTVRAS